jgi:hypothetical protein
MERLPHSKYNKELRLEAVRLVTRLPPNLSVRFSAISPNHMQTLTGIPCSSSPLNLAAWRPDTGYGLLRRSATDSGSMT